MLLSETGLGALLASLGLASSLFKPVSSLVEPTQVAHSFRGPVRSISHEADVPVPIIQSVEHTTMVSGHFAPRSPRSSGSTTTSTKLIPSLAPRKPARDAACAVEPYESPIVNQTFAPFDKARAILYRYRQQQAVNLGSWFVHEQWMTPSLFTCASGQKISEIDIASGWGDTSSARALLERHWVTFINETDFERLASIGINTVRLPIGYWNLPAQYSQNTPFESVSDVYQNSWQHILRAINMAANVGIGVLVDLHGAPGSQNGQPHSGISDTQTNLFTSPAFQDQTIQVLTFLVQQLANVTNVVGIEILNEPKNVPQLLTFYDRALAAVRQVSPEAKEMPFYVHDGFDLGRISKYVSNRTDFVVQDHHSYFVYTPKDKSESANSHTQGIRGSVAESLAAASKSQRNNLVVGEWSCALAPESLTNETDPKPAQMQFCEAQMEVYRNNTAGWMFWSYDKEDCENDSGWCFKNAVGKSLPSTFFSYPGQAGQFDGDGFTTKVLSALSKTQLPDLSKNFTLDYATQAVSKAHQSSALVSNRGKREHRFAAVHSRSQPVTQQAAEAARHAMIMGYKDGFLTAIWFAMYGRSKLGFAGQYIEDCLVSLDPTVLQPGNEDFYRESFRLGLGHGEKMVTLLLRQRHTTLA